MLWWAWGGYAWLTNAFDPESQLMRIPVFIAMGALLVAVALICYEAVRFREVRARIRASGA